MLHSCHHHTRMPCNCAVLPVHSDSMRGDLQMCRDHSRGQCSPWDTLKANNYHQLLGPFLLALVNGMRLYATKSACRCGLWREKEKLNASVPHRTGYLAMSASRKDCRLRGRHRSWMQQIGCAWCCYSELQLADLESRARNSLKSGCGTSVRGPPWPLPHSASSKLPCGSSSGFSLSNTVGLHRFAPSSSTQPPFSMALHNRTGMVGDKCSCGDKCCTHGSSMHSATGLPTWSVCRPPTRIDQQNTSLQTAQPFQHALPLSDRPASLPCLPAPSRDRPHCQQQ
jgi:hypothetical protein